MDESAKSGVRTRKRNKSIKDSAKSVKILFACQKFDQNQAKMDVNCFKSCDFTFSGTRKYSPNTHTCERNQKADFKR